LHRGPASDWITSSSSTSANSSRFRSSNADLAPLHLTSVRP
jgi:hypothetical protein